MSGVNTGIQCASHEPSDSANVLGASHTYVHRGSMYIH